MSIFLFFYPFWFHFCPNVTFVLKKFFLINFPSGMRRIGLETIFFLLKYQKCFLVIYSNIYHQHYPYMDMWCVSITLFDYKNNRRSPRGFSLITVKLCSAFFPFLARKCGCKNNWKWQLASKQKWLKLHKNVVLLITKRASLLSLCNGIFMFLQMNYDKNLSCFSINSLRSSTKLTRKAIFLKKSKTISVIQRKVLKLP